MLIDLPTAKAHIRDDAAPDDQVQLYLRAAEQSAAQFLNRRIYANEPELAEALATVPAGFLAAVTAWDVDIGAADALGDHRLIEEGRESADQKYFRAAAAVREIRDGIVINDAIKAAILLIFGSLYSNREDVVVGVSVADLPQGSRHLLQPYRVGMGV